MKQLLAILSRNKGKATVSTVLAGAVAFLCSRGCDFESSGFKIHVQPVNATTNAHETTNADFPALPQ